MLRSCDCAICYTMMILPTALPCKHTFCLPCIQKTQANSLKCPMCRASCPDDFEPNIDSELQAKIGNFRIDCASSTKILKGWPVEFKKLSGGKAPGEFGLEFVQRGIRIKFGNHYNELVQRQENQNKHKWQFFVETLKYPTEKIVQKLDIKLHPSFKIPKVTVEKAPFTLTRVGWGYFEL